MASGRRPTYTSPGGARPAKTGSGSDASGRGPGRTDDADVISASKSAPPAEGASDKKATARGKRSPGRQTVDYHGDAGKRTIKGARMPWQKGPQEDEPDSSANVLAFPEPRGKRLKRKLVITVCTVAAVVAGILAAAVFSPLLAVGTVTVTGTRLLTPEQVQGALEPLKGKPLPQISEDEVNGLLAPLVQIKSVTTEARPPSELVIEVRERAPVALVKQGEQYQLVDVDGVQLAATAEPSSVSLPVIDGGAGTIGKELFQATAAVLGALPPDILAKLSNASAQSVDAVELKLVDGQTIVWGNASERELKAKVLEALLKVPADPKNPVKVYDVSVPRHPVTR